MYIFTYYVRNVVLMAVPLVSLVRKIFLVYRTQPTLLHPRHHPNLTAPHPTHPTPHHTTPHLPTPPHPTVLHPTPPHSACDIVPHAHTTQPRLRLLAICVAHDTVLCRSAPFRLVRCHRGSTV